MNNFSMTIEGKQGIFRQELHISFLYEHETKEKLREQMAEVKKQIVKMLKVSNVTITTREYDSTTYANKESNYTRYCLDSYMYNGTFKLEERPYNRSSRNFSTINPYNFTKQSDMMKWLMNSIESDCLFALGNIPESGKSLFSMELDAKYDREMVNSELE